MVSSAQRVLGSPPAPPSPLLRRRGLGRRLEGLEFPLSDFRRAAKASGGSVNAHYDTASITDGPLFLRCLHEGFDEILALDPERSATATRAAPRTTTPRKAASS
jgi:hypothetical protein